MDDLSQQVEEIEALVAIYGNDWRTEDEENRTYSINITEDKNYVQLYVKLPKDYPSCSPPTYEMSAPHLSPVQKLRLGNLLDEVYVQVHGYLNDEYVKGILFVNNLLKSEWEIRKEWLIHSFISSCNNIGQNVIFQWIERIREELQSGVTESQESEGEPETDIENVVIPITEIQSSHATDYSCPEIVHGEVIVDRKSSFQGHAAVVTSTNQVQQVLKKLYENKKIEHATHNMYAYRIYNEDTKVVRQDCEDDGETQAGGRLLHLLQIIDVKNVMVIVTRWYGGTHLGPDRFRHINNAARQVLEVANLLPEHKDKKK